MPPIRALVALEDLGLHQVVEDILEITFKEVKTERVMSSEALFERLREHGEEYDLVLLDVQFDSDAEQSPLAVVRAELPALADRLVLVIPRSRSSSLDAQWEGFSRVVLPFVLDDFSATVREVRERAKSL